MDTVSFSYYTAPKPTLKAALFPNCNLGFKYGIIEDGVAKCVDADLPPMLKVSLRWDANSLFPKGW
jgi:hypothetical protein